MKKTPDPFTRLVTPNSLISNQEDAKNLFVKTCLSLGRSDQTNINKAWEKILAAYKKPTRYYHTLEGHILYGLNLLAKLYFTTDAFLYQWNFRVVCLAWFYHDSIMEFSAADNEEKSADFAVRELEKLGFVSGFSVEEPTAIKNLILGTRHFRQTGMYDTKELIQDIDLAIMGEKESCFQLTRAAIAYEYSDVDWKTFCSARAEVLKKFWERKKIFLTPYFANREKQAKYNLSQEIKKLAGPTKDPR